MFRLNFFFSLFLFVPFSVEAGVSNFVSFEMSVMREFSFSLFRILDITRFTTCFSKFRGCAPDLKVKLLSTRFNDSTYLGLLKCSRRFNTSKRIKECCTTCKQIDNMAETIRKFSLKFGYA